MAEALDQDFRPRTRGGLGQSYTYQGQASTNGSEEAAGRASAVRPPAGEAHLQRVPLLASVLL